MAGPMDEFRLERVDFPEAPPRQYGHCAWRADASSEKPHVRQVPRTYGIRVVEMGVFQSMFGTDMSSAAGICAASAAAGDRTPPAG